MARSRRLIAAWAIGGLCWLCLAAPVGAERAYVSNEDDNSVAVLDVATHAVIGTIAVGKRPRGIKLSSDGSRLFVAVSGLPKCPPSVPDEECEKLERDVKVDGIAMVDTSKMKVVKHLSAGSDPEQFDLSRDGKRLFVSNEDAGTVSVVDIDRGKVIERIVVGPEPEGVVTSPDGKWVLVTNEADDSVSIIDASALKVLSTVKVGKRPRDLAFTPDSATAFVSGELDASLYRVPVPQGKPAQRVLQMRPDARPMAIVADWPGHRLYVSTGRGGTIAVVDLKGPALLKEIEVGTRPWGIALAGKGRWLYTANGPSNDVSVVDTTTLRTVKTIAVGRSPWGVAVGPAPTP